MTKFEYLHPVGDGMYRKDIIECKRISYDNGAIIFYDKFDNIIAIKPLSFVKMIQGEPK